MAAVSFSAPRFTAEDEVREKAAMSKEEIVKAEADLYGKNDIPETPEMITEGIANLREALDEIHPSLKGALVQAQLKCPRLVENLMMAFLRFDKFDHKVASDRVVKYWETRLLIFGEDKAFLPLRPNLALSDDDAALKMGLFQYLPKTDKAGRGIIFSDKNRWDRTKCSRLSMVRSLWYMIHICLESDVNQKKGIVKIIYPQQYSFNKYDRKLDKMVMEKGWNVIPLRIGAMHFCNLPRFMELVLPMMKYVMGPTVRRRLILHEGSKGKVFAELESYGITKDMIPTVLEGDLEFDYDEWLKKRRAQDEVVDTTEFDYDEWLKNRKSQDEVVDTAEKVLNGGG